jgi:hypothetical protein
MARTYLIFGDIEGKLDRAPRRMWALSAEGPL